MTRVIDLIHARLNGARDSYKIAFVASGGGMRWPIAGGMLTRLRAHRLQADIMGGTSGGGLAMLFYADGGALHRGLVLQNLTARGFNRNGGPRFIRWQRMLRREPIMDLPGLIHDAFTLRQPVEWHAFKYSVRPVFLIATRPNGDKVVQRLDGSTAPICKEMALNSARIPWVAHRVDDRQVGLWDGTMSEDIPIQSAFELGATHVVALMCGRLHHEMPALPKLERHVMWPLLQRQNPQLAELFRQRRHNHVATVQRFREDPRVLFAHVPNLPLSNLSTNEQDLMNGLLAGWHHIGRLLGLPELPYPHEWQRALHLR